MKVNFSNYNISAGNIFKTPSLKIQHNNQKLLSKPSYDTFVKTINPVSFKAVEDVSDVTFTNERLGKIFDATFEEVFSMSKEDNQFLDDVNMSKPSFEIGGISNHDFLVYYTREDNTVHINQKFIDKLNSDVAFLVLLDKNGKESKIDSRMFSPEMQKEAIKHFSGKGLNVKPLILSEDEKEVLLKGALAHEIRHAVQSHFVFSSDEIDWIKEYYKEQDEEQKMFAKFFGGGINIVFEKTYDYVLNYQPRKLLSSDTRLKSYGEALESEYFDGWSAKELSPGGKLPTNGESQYYAQPVEIDAYLFESDYLKRYLVDTPEDKELRIPILNVIYANAFDEARRSIDCYNQN